VGCVSLSLAVPESVLSVVNRGERPCYRGKRCIWNRPTDERLAALAGAPAQGHPAAVSPPIASEPGCGRQPQGSGRREKTAAARAIKPREQGRGKADVDRIKVLSDCRLGADSFRLFLGVLPDLSPGQNGQSKANDVIRSSPVL